MSNVNSLSALMIAARDTRCPVCDASLRVTSTKASGPHLRCNGRTSHTFDVAIEDRCAIGTPRFGSRIGTPVHPFLGGALMGEQA